jgi:thiol-disulfide isomerase/thioredoxin
MKKTIVVLVVIFLGAFAASAQAESIVWETDFKRAHALARETNRPMLLDFTADWCKPCKAMDAEFWVLPEVVRATKAFVAVKIDYDEEKSLVGRYNGGAIPFVAFTDPLGNTVTFRRGFSSKNAKEINLIFNEMPKDFSPVKDAYGALDQNKNDGDALTQIADFYAGAKMLVLSCDFYKRALKSDRVKADAEKRERIQAALGANYFLARADAQAVEHLSNYLKDYPAGKKRELSLAMIAVSSARLGKQKEAVKHLEALKAEFPQSKNIEAVGKALEEAKNKPDKK